jgi:hypothetical protein
MFTHETARIDYTGAKLKSVCWWEAAVDDNALLVTGSFDEQV